MGTLKLGQLGLSTSPQSSTLITIPHPDHQHPGWESPRLCPAHAGPSQPPRDPVLHGVLRGQAKAWKFRSWSCLSRALWSQTE